MSKQLKKIVKERLEELAIGQREFGRRLGHDGAGLISHVLNGRRPVPQDAIDDWIQHLKIEGSEARRFRTLALLSSAPEPLRELVELRDQQVESLILICEGLLPRSFPEATPAEIKTLLRAIDDHDFPKVLQQFLWRHLGTKKEAPSSEPGPKKR